MWTTRSLLKRIIRSKLKAFERRYDYDVSYMDEVLEADPGALVAIARVQRMSRYRKGVPVAPWYAAKIVGAMAEDCGPCTQLVVRMAEEAGVPEATLRATIAGDDAALEPDVRLAVRFARASLARDVAADPLREQILARWGLTGLTSLAFALASARVYPTLKYALGHGRACTRVVVGTSAVAPGSGAAHHASPSVVPA